ncbi:MAG: IPExxxVDY family protein [Chitinophagales bacterium]|nr:IPExxxVDY family protein [Chitinophagales bacterium]
MITSTFGKTGKQIKDSSQLAKKRIVTLEDHFSGVLWGIVTQVKEYQLSWHLNKALGFDLKRTDDLEIIHKKKNKTSAFSFYRYEHALDKWQVIVLSNKHAGEFLLPEVKQVDYLLMVKGEISAEQEEGIFAKVKEIHIVQLLVKLDFQRLKSKENLMVE